ncbi:uncharacterized protein A1O9_05291 [Exophiala aquamarina CBS 119918]|uniref:Major facilitator superfamily (MFS) profile domain-containing protein n=1 Tax=Exophiala aquamarina CBS 119918 TaxID=1182545 RepID=A0A072PBA5_9EURO|nr:uncharacterized protein A1O9_05291 [Exophiala aquamarina CBS 119918]KEF57374.1 hypothetical protein A1O9_05291 [Exophiala aquamarina CBS 119918]
MVISGQNVGGVIWAVLVNQLVNYSGVSLGWTLRIIGFMQLALMVAAVILIQPPFPREMPRESIKIKTYLTDKRTLLFTLASFIMNLGIYIHYTYVSIYGYQYGLSARMAFYLAPILDAEAFFGCYALGIVADTGFGFFDSLIITAFAFAVLGGGPIGGRLLENAGDTNYVPMQVFTGVCMVVSSCLYLVTPLWVSRDVRESV